MRTLLILVIVGLCLVSAKHIPHESRDTNSQLDRNKRSDSEDSNVASVERDDDSSNDNDNDDDNDTKEEKIIEEQSKQREKEERKKQKFLEKLEKERQKQVEELKKQEEKLAKQQRKEQERKEKEERKTQERIEKEKQKLEEQKLKTEEKLEKQERKRQEKLKKQIEKILEEQKESAEDTYLESEEEDSVEMEGIWKAHVYDKYGISVTSTKLERQAAIQRYLREEMGIDANSTKSERRQAILKLIQTKLQNDTAAIDSFRNLLLSHVNAIQIQKIRSKLENDLEELKNHTELLNNISLPWASVAQQNINEKRTFLQGIAQFLSNIIPNWFGSSQSSKPNASGDISSSNNINVLPIISTGTNNSDSIHFPAVGTDSGTSLANPSNLDESVDNSSSINAVASQDNGNVLPTNDGSSTNSNPMNAPASSISEPSSSNPPEPNGSLNHGAGGQNGGNGLPNAGTLVNSESSNAAVPVGSETMSSNPSGSNGSLDIGSLNNVANGQNDGSGLAANTGTSTSSNLPNGASGASVGPSLSNPIEDSGLEDSVSINNVAVGQNLDSGLSSTSSNPVPSIVATPAESRPSPSDQSESISTVESGSVNSVDLGQSDSNASNSLNTQSLNTPVPSSGSSSINSSGASPSTEPLGTNSGASSNNSSEVNGSVGSGSLNNVALDQNNDSGISSNDSTSTNSVTSNAGAPGVLEPSSSNLSNSNRSEDSGSLNNISVSTNVGSEPVIDASISANSDSSNIPADANFGLSSDNLSEPDKLSADSGSWNNVVGGQNDDSGLTVVSGTLTSSISSNIPAVDSSGPPASNPSEPNGSNLNNAAASQNAGNTLPNAGSSVNIESSNAATTVGGDVMTSNPIESNGSLSEISGSLNNVVVGQNNGSELIIDESTSASSNSSNVSSGASAKPSLGNVSEANGSENTVSLNNDVENELLSNTASSINPELPNIADSTPSSTDPAEPIGSLNNGDVSQNDGNGLSNAGTSVSSELSTAALSTDSAPITSNPSESLGLADSSFISNTAVVQNNGSGLAVGDATSANSSNVSLGANAEPSNLPEKNGSEDTGSLSNITLSSNNNSGLSPNIVTSTNTEQSNLAASSGSSSSNLLESNGTGDSGSINKVNVSQNDSNGELSNTSTSVNSEPSNILPESISKKPSSIHTEPNGSVASGSINNVAVGQNEDNGLTSNAGTLSNSQLLNTVAPADSETLSSNQIDPNGSANGGFLNNLSDGKNEGSELAIPAGTSVNTISLPSVDNSEPSTSNPSELHGSGDISSIDNVVLNQNDGNGLQSNVGTSSSSEPPLNVPSEDKKLVGNGSESSLINSNGSVDNDSWNDVVGEFAPTGSESTSSKPSDLNGSTNSNPSINDVVSQNNGIEVLPDPNNVAISDSSNVSALNDSEHVLLNPETVQSESETKLNPNSSNTVPSIGSDNISPGPIDVVNKNVSVNNEVNVVSIPNNIVSVVDKNLVATTDAGSDNVETTISSILVNDVTNLSEPETLSSNSEALQTTASPSELPTVNDVTSSIVSPTLSPVDINPQDVSVTDMNAVTGVNVDNESQTVDSLTVPVLSTQDSSPIIEVLTEKGPLVIQEIVNTPSDVVTVPTEVTLPKTEYPEGVIVPVEAAASIVDIKV